MIITVNKLTRLRSVPILNRIATECISILGVDLPLSVVIGDKVDFRHNAIGTVIHKKTTIENDVQIFQNVTLGRADISLHEQDSGMEGILIKRGAIISAGAKVLCKEGVLTIGENSLIAANAVVLQSVPDNEVWGGIPARKIADLKNAHAS